MKLYELKRGAHFRIIDRELNLPPASIPIDPSDVFKFVKIDGMYSICHDSDNNIHHLAAWTEVSPVDQPVTEGETHE